MSLVKSKRNSLGTTEVLVRLVTNGEYPLTDLKAGQIRRATRKEGYSEDRPTYKVYYTF